jgi:phosphohistidine phosphatase
MDLYILRHAIAEERSGSMTGGDSQRRLTAEGKTRMRRAAKGMKALELDFDLILTSPFVRAKETADIVAEVFGLKDALKQTPSLAADGNPKDLIDELRGHYHKRKQILLVGHEPYLSRLISLLLSGDTAIAITLKKGGLCKLSTKSLQYGRCATLEWLLTPGQMRSVR